MLCQPIAKSPTIEIQGLIKQKDPLIPFTDMGVSEGDFLFEDGIQKNIKKFPCKVPLKRHK